MKAKILVADDSAYMRSILKDLLLRSGYEVAGEAENGREAVRLYEKLAPDLVLMDILMPEMSGIQALKEIKEKYPDSRIVMLGALGQQNLVVEAMQAGASEFFVKPVQAEKVAEVIEKVLKRGRGIFGE